MERGYTFSMKQMVQLFSAAFFAPLLVACSQQATETLTKKETQGEEHELQTANWSYSGETGPISWGDLDQTYTACVNGREQSPINVDYSEVKTTKTIETIDFQYKPTSFSVINNGHTIQVNNESERNKMIVEGTEYGLVQFHFHTPSEHQFSGQQYAMELHLVHQNENNELAVLGVMIQEGVVNKNLQTIWDALPKQKTTEEAIFIREPINLQVLLSQEQTFLYYNGSLTTPPCTEEVKWIVLEQPIEMSKEQIEVFQQIFPHNNRPVQPLNEREIIRN